MVAITSHKMESHFCTIEHTLESVVDEMLPKHFPGIKSDLCCYIDSVPYRHRKVSLFGFKHDSAHSSLFDLIGGRTNL